MSKARLIACTQLLLALLVLGGVWLGLPARWLWVDAPGTALGVASVVAAVALLRGESWAPALSRVVLWAELVLGTACVTLLAVSAAQLAGSYGPVGAGGALLMVTIAALVLPYFVVLPALQLRWLVKPR
jgi:hypothetical protein